MKKKRAICINGVMNNVTAELQRVVPRGLVARIAGRLYRPSENLTSLLRLAGCEKRLLRQECLAAGTNTLHKRWLPSSIFSP